MNDQQKKQLGIYLLIGVLVLIALSSLGCEQLGGLLGNNGGANGNNGGTCNGNGTQTVYVDAECTRCNSEWNAQSWQCTGKCTTGTCQFDNAYPDRTNPYAKATCSCQNQQTSGCQLYNGICTGSCQTGYSCMPVSDSRGNIVDCTCSGTDYQDTCDDTCKKYYGTSSQGYCAYKSGIDDTCTHPEVPGYLLYPGISTADGWCYGNSPYRTCCCKNPPV